MTEKELWINKLQKICSQREMCEADVYEKLKNSKLSVNEIKEIVENLKIAKYIDEERYVNAFVHDKLYLNLWGKIKIKHALMHKKIDEKLINKVLDQNIDEQEYLQIFLELARKKMKTYMKENDNQKKHKLANFLVQRGVEYDVVFRIISMLFSN
ncbi:MAG: RecX family transcriptional regulator [Bacteroidales bacterium]|nr:RecX family transcriptional regulator [Bacteroidales bacterium]